MSDTPDLPISPADLGATAADLPSAEAPTEPVAQVTTEISAASAPQADGLPLGSALVPDPDQHPIRDEAASASAPAATAAPVTESATEPAAETNADAPPSAAADPSPKAAREMSPGACAELLKQHFPALFGGQPKPLKLRIQADIAQRAPGVFSKGAMSAFFRRYTGSTGYLIALGKASQRFDLDGQPAGDLSEEHRQLAREELTRRRQITRDRDQQAQAQMQAQQQAQQAELQQARQTRLALLRDFERTTLTPANFCALKGLTAETLEPLLAQARREAAEAPPPRAWQPEDRRGPPINRRGAVNVGGRAGGADGGPREQRSGPRPEGHEGRGGQRPPRPDSRPAGAGGRPDARTDVRSDVRSDVRTEARTDARPSARPDSRPASRTDARPGGQNNGRPNGRPTGR